MSKKARNRGYNPELSTELKLEYVEDAPRLGALLKVTPKLEAAIVKAIEEGNRNERAKPAALLGYEHGVSQSTILNILKRNRFKPCKTTKKSGLTEKMRKAIPALLHLLLHLLLYLRCHSCADPNCYTYAAISTAIPAILHLLLHLFLYLRCHMCCYTCTTTSAATSAATPAATPATTPAATLVATPAGTPAAIPALPYLLLHLHY